MSQDVCGAMRDEQSWKKRGNLGTRFPPFFRKNSEKNQDSKNTPEDWKNTIVLVLVMTKKRVRT